MAKFLYITDSHFGASPQKYFQQRPYTEKLPAIVRTLKDVAKEEKVDFILHGGDMIHTTTQGNIEGAAQLFTGEIPLYLCLGNHDLTVPDALQKWLQFAPQFFVENRAECSVITEDFAIHIVPNQWGDSPYYWKDEQRAHFREKQLSFLENALSKHKDRPHLLLTHSPVFGLPTEQTGFAEIYHSPVTKFSETIKDFAARYSHLRCVLGAHSHLNMCVESENVRYVTSSAIVETPFECKLFEISRKEMTMKTLTLASKMGFLTDYNFEKTFVQGRATDRGFTQSI